MRTRAILGMVVGVAALIGCRTPHCSTSRPEAECLLSPAESDFAQALAHFSAGMMHEGSRTSRVSVLQYTRAIELDPTRVELYTRIAADHLGRQETDAAIEILRASVEHNPRSDSARLVLGTAYQMAGRFDEAVEQYRRAIRLAPRSAEGYVKIASIRVAQDRHGAAVDALDAGLARATNTTEILRLYEGLGKLYIAGKQMPEAVRCFRRIAERQPESALAQEILARTLVAAGEPRDALAALRRLATLQPENGAVDAFMGEVQEELGDLDGAVRSYTAAIAKPPLHRDPFVRLANIQLQRDVGLSLTTIEEAARRLPRDPLVFTFLGLIRNVTHRYTEAVDAFRQAEQNALAPAAPDHTLVPMFYFWYGAACERSGQFERAEELFARCIALYPDLDEAYNYLAYMWAERGINLDRALGYVTRALELKAGDPAYLDTLGWVYFKQGRYADALAHILEARRLVPDDPTILDHAGDAYAALGKTKQAVDAWTRSLKLDPTNQAVADKLRRHGVDVSRLRLPPPSG